MKKKSFLELLNEVNEERAASSPQQEQATVSDEQEFGFINRVDAEIVMHRDVHFGGKFEEMLAYYHTDGKGCHPDFSLDRIDYLAQCERELQGNLASTLLTGTDAERVHRAKEIYIQLKELYEKEDESARLPLLIADLILSEEEEPQQEKEALIQEGEEAVELLVQLMQSDLFLDPLYPGYGQAPLFAAQCLGQIGSKRAVMALFEMMGKVDFEMDGACAAALYEIGAPARDFLLQILQNTPMTYDTERAAQALSHFAADSHTAHSCLQLLTEELCTQNPRLAMQVALNCEGLQDPAHQKTFESWTHSPHFPQEIHEDSQLFIKNWQRKNPS